MKIIKAAYGGSDCTEQVRMRVINDKLLMRACNNIIGDPRPGIKKQLEIQYQMDNENRTVVYEEGNLVSLSSVKLNRLGIFYSNNNDKRLWPAIYKSLDTIQAASEGKADIITCVWEFMICNPFHQIISWYKVPSHLTQLLQIMQCLFLAKEMNSYEYVSFLEHDVMYPEGYFDYPDFNKGFVLTNMNYGGLCKDGWQVRKQNDVPFHQMTMHLDDAIQHCLFILPNALKTNSGLIEKQTDRITWECKNQAIHVNHGIHFTSHYSIYDKTNLTKIHPYWGDYSDYNNLFY